MSRAAQGRVLVWVLMPMLMLALAVNASSAWAQAAVPTAPVAPPAPGAPVAPLVTQVQGEAQIGSGWRVAGLPQQRVPLTRYRAEMLEGRAAVRLEAAASYGNLVFDLASRAAPQRLRWSWRMEAPNTAVNLTQKSGDDAAAKVCLAFELPLANVPFIERQLLRMARSQTGEALPAATLCWVWGHGEAHDALIANPYSRRVRVIVLRNQADAPGRWFDEERDIATDWRRAFGEESAEVPPLSALAVAADADNTGARSVAHVAGLRFAP